MTETEHPCIESGHWGLKLLRHRHIQPCDFATSLSSLALLYFPCPTKGFDCSFQELPERPINPSIVIPEDPGIPSNPGLLYHDPTQSQSSALHWSTRLKWSFQLLNKFDLTFCNGLNCVPPPKFVCWSSNL